MKTNLLKINIISTLLLVLTACATVPVATVESKAGYSNVAENKQQNTPSNISIKLVEEPKKSQKEKQEKTKLEVINLNGQWRLIPIRGANKGPYQGSYIITSPSRQPDSTISFIIRRSDCVVSSGYLATATRIHREYYDKTTREWVFHELSDLVARVDLGKPIQVPVSIGINPYNQRGSSINLEPVLTSALVNTMKNGGEMLRFKVTGKHGNSNYFIYELSSFSQSYWKAINICKEDMVSRGFDPAIGEYFR